jgi:hypothetical protein
VRRLRLLRRVRADVGATPIEWTEFSINPLRARLNGRQGHYCEKLSAGCKNCYSSRLQPRFGMPQFQEQRSAVVDHFLDPKALPGGGALSVHIPQPDEATARDRAAKWGAGSPIAFDVAPWPFDPARHAFELAQHGGLPGTGGWPE